MNFDWKTEYYRYRRYFFSLGKIGKTAPVRSFAWLSLTLFAIAFFAVMAIRPTLITIAKLNREIKDKKDASQKLQTKINAIVAAQALYARNLDHLPLLEEALPEKSEFPRLAFFFEENATASNVELKTLNFEKIGVSEKGSSSSSSTANSLYFSLNVAGDYAYLKDFTRRLETSRRILKIDSAAFSQVKKEEGWQLTLRVTGQASFSKNQVEPKPTQAPSQK
ncbi:MAG TPA: type 4a pilus biogenesis protein PilO [Patescibacteria group bacterium]|nr:type 4a pilus biogenesis protein PilO [Patescibacteria group bacterium]